MSRRKVLSRGMNLGRHGEVGYVELDGETKLEDEIEKVKSSKISDKDKARIIAQLNAAIEKLQEQYDDDVAAEEAKVQEEIMEELETMDEAVEELDQQADSLRNVTMDAASTDAKAAADEAEAKKQEFEKMRKEYTDKLQLQMEQAEMLQRQIRSRRLSGR